MLQKRKLNDEYLEEAVKAYEHFFVENNEDLQGLGKVSAPIKGSQYFLPLGSQEAARA